MYQNKVTGNLTSSPKPGSSATTVKWSIGNELMSEFSIIHYQHYINFNLVGPTKWVSWDETGYGAPETQHAPVVHPMSNSVFNGVLNVFIYGDDGYLHHIWQTTCDKVPNPWGWCTWSVWYKISDKIPETVPSNNPLSIGANIHLGIEVLKHAHWAAFNLSFY